MGKFITRIELRDANSSDYDKLNIAMLNAGFSRTVMCDEGNTFMLPAAEYYKEVLATVQEVFKEAEIIANTTGRKNWILTCETTNRIWKLQELL